MKKQIISLSYNRDHVTSGILHIGVGNFHRAHLAFYMNNLLSDSSQNQWGICGLNLLQGDERIVKGLAKQITLYPYSMW